MEKQRPTGSELGQLDAAVPSWARHQEEEMSLRRLSVRGFAALALCAAWMALFFMSLNKPVTTYSDAMSAKTRKATIGWDYVIGPNWIEGWTSLSICALAAAWIVAVELTPAPWLRLHIATPRILMGVLLGAVCALYLLNIAATAVSWAGFDYGRGYHVWLASLVTLFVATIVARRGRREDAAKDEDPQQGFEVIR